MNYTNKLIIRDLLYYIYEDNDFYYFSLSNFVSNIYNKIIGDELKYNEQENRNENPDYIDEQCEWLINFSNKYFKDDSILDVIKKVYSRIDETDNLDDEEIKCEMENIAEYITGNE